MKVLIIRFSSIGDIILTTPVLRCIKLQGKATVLHFLTKKEFLPVVEHNPYIDKIFTLDNSLETTIHELKEEAYDLIIDLHKNLRTQRVRAALKVKTYSFNKLNIQKWLFTNFKINLLPKIHIVDRYMDTIKQLGVDNDGKGLDYFIKGKDIVSTDDIPTSHQLGFIAIAIGAALATKQLPVHKLKELCTKINYPIILLGGKEDRQKGDEIAVGDNIKIYNACGKFSLNESADLVRRSKLLITHDTGLMHIAAAFKKPIISVWGNTVPAFGMAPYYGASIVQQYMFGVQNLYCRPCSKIGYNSCPKKHFKCMEKQDTTAIAQQTMLILAKK